MHSVENEVSVTEIKLFFHRLFLGKKGINMKYSENPMTETGISLSYQRVL